MACLLRFALLVGTLGIQVGAAIVTKAAEDVIFLGFECKGPSQPSVFICQE